MITHENCTQGNCEIPEILKNHEHEEADTLLILHASSIEKDAIVTIKSPDTDVLILLIHFYSCLPLHTFFFTGAGKTKRIIPLQQRVPPDKIGELGLGSDFENIPRISLGDQKNIFEGKNFSTPLPLPPYSRKSRFLR
jgi:hypothetical protein